MCLTSHPRVCFSLCSLWHSNRHVAKGNCSVHIVSNFNSKADLLDLGFVGSLDSFALQFRDGRIRSKVCCLSSKTSFFGEMLIHRVQLVTSDSWRKKKLKCGQVFFVNIIFNNYVCSQVIWFFKVFNVFFVNLSLASSLSLQVMST